MSMVRAQKYSVAIACLGAVLLGAIILIYGNGLKMQLTPALCNGAALCLVFVGLLWALALQSIRTERARKKQEETQSQFQAVLSNIPQGVCFYSGEGKLVLCNQRYLEMFALDSDRVKPGMTIAEIIAMARAAGIKLRERSDLLVNGRLQVNLAEGDHAATLDLQDGRLISLRYRIMPGGSWIATHEDVSHRRQADEKITYLARHDPLTGLVNRVVLRELIDAAVPEAERGNLFALLFLDLDRFKAVNDTLGHAAGDALLNAVADRLRATVRAIDTIARIGGDEFVILQPTIELPEGAMRLAGRVIEALSAPYMLGGQEARIGVSVGIAMAPADGKTSEALLKSADLALYLAKSEGRGTFRFFEAEMDARLVRRHEMERSLRTALEKSQFELLYQPIINMRTGHVDAFEALLRWNHPELGVLLPASFLSTAEECGVMGPVGEWVLQQACAQAQSWPAPVALSVNLARTQLRQSALPHSIETILQKTGLPAGRLQLELHEQSLFESGAHCGDTIREIQAAGINFALDGFGAGHISLQLLEEFAFDRIKFDRNFMLNAGLRPQSMAIFRAVLRLANELGCHVTLVGIEDAAQWAAMKDCGASHTQGFLFSKPLRAGEIPAWLAEFQLNAQADAAPRTHAA